MAAATLGLRRFLFLVAALGVTLGLSGCMPAHRSSDPPASLSAPRRSAHSRMSRSPARDLPSRPPDPYPHGALFTVAIPGGTSGFRPRPAYVYLPPAALRDVRLRLPVLELLHGNPGEPSNWPDRGGMRTTFDEFAARHRGVAPVVVMPDINGTYHGDSECIRTPDGADVEEYLTVQLPRFVRTHFPVSADSQRWAVAGVSEGGTCALTLALRHYPQYRAFGDFSGLGRPTLGEADDEQRTLAELYGGSRAAYDEHDPLWLLPRHHYPSLAGWLMAGTQDQAVVKDERIVAAEARAAGLDVREVETGGRHNWPLWTRALGQFLPWLWHIVGNSG